MSDVAIRPDAAPALLDAARNALAEVESLPEITHLIDRAEVARVAARKAKLSAEAQNDWAEFKVDAQRKAGQMLSTMEKHPGAAVDKLGTPSHDVRPSPRLSDIGISYQQSHRWQLLAKLPDDVYSAYKAAKRADVKGEITEAGAVALAKRLARREMDLAATRARPTATQTDSGEPQGNRQPPAIEKASWSDWLPAQDECDLLVTDPPYSTDVDDIEEFAAGWLPVALAKVKPTGRAYVCIGAYPRELRAYLNVEPPNGMTLANILVWTYRNTLGPSPTYDYKLNWQAILYYRGVDADPLNCPVMVEQFSVQDINAPDGRLGDRYHAWQKPLTLAERIVRHSTKPGDLVLDPFAGTGTFVLAAAQLDCIARGCDIDPDMLAIAAERGCVVEG